MRHVSQCIPKHFTAGGFPITTAESDYFIQISNWADQGYEAAIRRREELLIERRHRDSILNEVENLKYGQIGASGPVCMLCDWYFDAKNGRSAKGADEPVRGGSRASIDSDLAPQYRFSNTGTKSHGETLRFHDDFPFVSISTRTR